MLNMILRQLAPYLTQVREAADAYASDLFDKSKTIAGFLDKGMARLFLVWLCCTIPLALFRLANPASVVHDPSDAAPILIAYTLLIVAPAAGYLIARNAFLSERAKDQPFFRFAVIGKWRPLDKRSVQSHGSFGAVGFMASLLIGLLLNVVFRTGEFFLAVPAMSNHAPDWGQAMFTMMAADVIITNFFYMVCFVMALRNIPLFPRMLLFAWSVDILMQLLVANQIAIAGDVPAMVSQPLVSLLHGNISKVLISAMVWLPYLILSERVNVTYRHRVAV